MWENIASPLRVAKLPKAEIRRRVEAMAELLKLTPMLQRRPAELYAPEPYASSDHDPLVVVLDLQRAAQ